MSYTKFEIKKKVNLADLTGSELDLQSILRFSQGTKQTREELHYEDSPDPEVAAYEILIPMDAPIKLRISPVKADEGTPKLDEFNIVIVDENEGVIIHPKICHSVTEAGRFLVLKTRCGWKYSRKAATPEGKCRFQASCKSRDYCPNPKANWKL